jgi:GAF domain-containing protein
VIRAAPGPHLAAVAEALAAPDQPRASFDALEAALGAVIGHRLFTVMRHAAAGWNARVYSSMPGAWPVGGRKPVREHPWTDRVLRRGEPWTGSGEAAMRWAYPDHELIAAHGLGAALNLPVRWHGRTLGALNLLHEAGWFTPADAEAGRPFAALAVPALLLAGARPTEDDQGRGRTA